MDAQTDADGNVAAGAYQQIFWILIGSAILAAISSLALYLYLRKRREPVEAEAPVETVAA
jgi:hypothetical protein